MAKSATTSLCNRWITPPALFVGVAVGFLACCAGGWLVSGRNPFTSFQRFHALMAPETHFYPTACQVRALARSRLDPSKIAVIVGGSSILHGTGQHASEVWTDKLQTLLGEDYQVLNLGLRAARTAEFGAIAAEILSREYPRLILITDLRVGDWPAAPDGYLYKYFYWDAYFKGLLLADEGRDARLHQAFAEAEQANRVHGKDRAMQLGFLDVERQEELWTQMRLDALLYFQDLWNTVGYTRFFTVWTSATQDGFTRPRRLYPDKDPGAKPLSVRFRACPPDLISGVRASMPYFCVNDSHQGWKEKTYLGAWPSFDQGICSTFPEPVRKRTLLLATWLSPYHIKLLSADERACYAVLSRLTRAHVERAGFPALEIGSNYQPSDYADWIHLSEGGGARMAEEVAPVVRDLARRLGYAR